MIRVALGTENFQFTRPLKWIDQAIDEGILPKDEEIRVQAGTTNYSPRNKNIVLFDFMDYNQQMKEFEESRIGIIHAGMGNILDFVDLDRVPIVIPRDPGLREHLDGHQLDFCDVAKNELPIPFVYTYEEFVYALTHYDAKRKFPSQRQSLIDFLIQQIEG